MIDFITDKFKDYDPYINSHQDMNKFSVFIPLIRNDNDEICILFQVRSKTLRNQPGEISFPGGRIEPNEFPADAALRETCEELGVSKSNLKLISSLDLFVNYTNMIIHPYVGIIDNINAINLNKDEVEEIFLVPLDYLLNIQPDYYDNNLQVTPSDDFPYELIHNGYDYKFKSSSYKITFYKYKNYSIWGITAKILENFIDILKS